MQPRSPGSFPARPRLASRCRHGGSYLRIRCVQAVSAADRLPDDEIAPGWHLVSSAQQLFGIVASCPGNVSVASAMGLGRSDCNESKPCSSSRSCRRSSTAALGGHVEACTDCGHQRIAYNSCRNRHCPKCQGAAARTWLAEREADLLPVGYFHVVFTLPAEIATKPASPSATRTTGATAASGRAS